jgi:heme-degrading monooxygenase HmoA
MFARVSRLEGDPARTDEAITYVREKILPDARGLEGHRGMLSLIDRSTGQMMAVTFWESEEAMRATEEAANQLRGDAAAATDAAIAGVERYEVADKERGGGAFARVTRSDAAPSPAADAITFVREKIIPEARQLDGNRGLLLLVDRATGKGLTVTFWETEEAMRATEETASRMRNDATAALDEDITGVERYEVAIDERP